MEKVGRSPRRSGPRISDVAALAGVSVATVSRVLTGSSPVAAAKREQILKAIEELDYRPSSLARSLSLGTTGVIGVVAPFFTFGATSIRLRGIMDRAAPEAYDVMIFNVESGHQRDDAFAKFARRDRLDGLIVISLPVGDADVAALRRQELPTVLVDVDHRDLSAVTIDNVAGGVLATGHLLSRGHTRIAFIGDAPASPLGYTSSDPRYQGYQRALAEAGVALDPALVWRAPPPRSTRPWAGGPTVVWTPVKRPSASSRALPRRPPSSAPRTCRRSARCRPPSSSACEFPRIWR